MNGRVKPGWWMFSFLGTVVFASLGMFITSEPWGWIFWGAAIVLCSSGIVLFANYVAQETAERVKDLYYSRIHPLSTLAREMKGLTGAQTDIISRFSHIEGIGVMGSKGVLWHINCMAEKVPLDLIHQILILSQEYTPFMLPIRQHDHPMLRDFERVEQRLTAFTNTLIANGLADEATGPFSARLRDREGVTLDWLAGEFGMELSDG